MVSLFQLHTYNFGLVYIYIHNTVKYWLDKHPETLENRFSKSFILEGIQLILENNTFCFDDIHYKQVKGTQLEPSSRLFLRH